MSFYLLGTIVFTNFNIIITDMYNINGLKY